MAAVEITTDDLSPFASIPDEKAEAMIADALALAARIAPCILTDEFEHAAAAKAIIRSAILRWNDAGNGAMQSQTAGPFGVTVDTRTQRRGMFWPSEITDLQALCIEETTSGAFEVDTMPTTAGVYGADYWWTGPDSTSTVF